MDNTYRINELKIKVRSSQAKAVLAINSELTQLYSFFLFYSGSIRQQAVARLENSNSIENIQQATGQLEHDNNQIIIISQQAVDQIPWGLLWLKNLRQKSLIL